MPELVSLSEDKSYIIVKSFGNVEKGNPIESLKEVLKLHDELGINRVLVDVREIENVPKIFDIFSFGEKLADSTRKIAIRFAVLVGNKKTESSVFVETVVLNRGGTLRVFKDNESALEWLYQK